jgi:hypothetical protein
MRDYEIRISEIGNLTPGCKGAKKKNLNTANFAALAALREIKLIQWGVFDIHPS